MKRSVLALAVTGLALSATPVLAQTTHRSTLHDFRVVTVAEGLVNPWSMAFLPGGDMLVTERPGRLRVVRNGNLLDEPVEGVPEVFARGQGGLLDVVPHPDFASNRLVYLSYSKPLGEDASTTAVVRARFENDRLHDVEEIFEANTEGRAGHYGSRLVFDEAGYLFVTVGDRQANPNEDQENHPAQDLSNHQGTVSRLHDDGRVPDDNPFVGQAGVEPSIWSYGHRNSQGLAIDPDGTIWAHEHGPQGGDELNRIQPGLNYGWPVVGYGVNYGSGSAIHRATQGEDFESPTHFWVPSIATSGLTVYSGDRFPEWRGSIFVGGMAGEQLARLEMNGPRVRVEETLIPGMGRVRDVRQGPDGYIYVAIDHRAGEPTPILRLEPAGD